MKELMNASAPTIPISAGEVAKPKNIMGKDDFMKLLVTQLRYQDPLNPMEQHEFAAHLAQFSQLEQLTNIGSGIQGLKTGMGDEAKLQALSMIGKKIEASGNEINLIEGQSVALRHSLEADVKPVKAAIYDPQGQLVRELDLSQSGGGKPIEWDGKNEQGRVLSSGKYLFRMLAVGKDGNAREVGADLMGRVTGVDFNGSSPVLIVQTPSGSTKVDLAKIRNVSVESDQKPSTVAIPAKVDNTSAEGPAPEPKDGPNAEDATLEVFPEERGFFNHLMER